MERLYLDNCSTTAISPRAREAMIDCETRFPANPSSQHQSGQRANRRLRQAQDELGRMLGLRQQGTDADQLIWTSGGTESNNLALSGLGGKQPSRVIVSAVEHPSVIRMGEYLASIGVQIDRCRVDHDGVLDLNHLDDLLTSPADIVSVMAANHETGVCQPIDKVSEICRARGSLLHCDATQWAGKLPTRFADWQIDALTVSGHKFHGPTGIGLLAIRHGVKLKPMLYGGFQQLGLRPGTESVGLAVGMEEALREFHDQADSIHRELRHMREDFEAALVAELDSITIHGQAAQRLPHVSNVAFAGLDRQRLLMALDLAGIDCSTGSACASGSSEPSPVLRAMGLPDELVEGSLRFSFGRLNRPSDGSQAASRIISCHKTLRHA